jgi:hypothetical protein
LRQPTRHFEGLLVTPLTLHGGIHFGDVFPSKLLGLCWVCYESVEGRGCLDDHLLVLNAFGESIKDGLRQKWDWQITE